MAVPRPVLLALLALAAIAGVLVITHGASQTSGNVAAAPPPVAKAHVAPAAPRASKPVHKAPAAVHSKPAHAAKTPFKPARKPATAATPGQAEAAAVDAAYNKGKVVVLFFSQSGPADDAAAATAVDQAQGMSGVAVFRAGLADIPSFHTLLAGAGVSETPAIVVMRSGQQARLIQGFVDPQTLRQTILDLR